MLLVDLKLGAAYTLQDSAPTFRFIRELNE